MATLCSILPEDVLSAVSGNTKTCLTNLVKYLTLLERPDLSVVPVLFWFWKLTNPFILRTSYPSSKRAAVLVILYEQGEVIRVVLTTRSMELRTHAGETALPGGKTDPIDADSIATAVSLTNSEGCPLTSRPMY